MSKFNVLSPDGIPIRPEPFTSKGEAVTALLEWSKRFAPQGYYSCASGELIPIGQLPSRCKIENIENDKQLSTEAEYYSKLLGLKVVGIVQDEGEPCVYGLLFNDSTTAWIQCDSEGNGPGWLSLQKGGKTL